MADVEFPNPYQILYSKIKNFIEELSSMEIAMLLGTGFFLLVLFVCFMTLLVECLVRCRIRRHSRKLSAEEYFKRSSKIAKRADKISKTKQKMSKINTPEFKHFELELQKDRRFTEVDSLLSLRESRLDSPCFIDRCKSHQDPERGE